MDEPYYKAVDMALALLDHCVKHGLNFDEVVEFAKDAWVEARR